MGEDMIKELAIKQRKRLCAGLLNAVESAPWHTKLSPAEKQAFRKEVFDRVGVYHDFMLDVIQVGDNQLINADALSLVERVHQSQRRIEQAIGLRGQPVG